MWTKRLLIEKAFGELALAGYAFDITPDEQQDMATRMDAMVANWLPDNIRLPYSFAADPGNVDIDADSGVPMVDARTVICGAAIDYAAGLGKQVHPSTRKAFADGYARLLRVAAFPPEQQLPSTMPRGAGNKPWRWSDNPFMPPPDTGPLQVAEDGGLNLGS